MFTMRPHPRSFMWGQTAWAQLNPPLRLTRRSRSHSSGDWSWNCADVVECPRVVHEDVDGAELLDGSRHRRSDLISIGDVAPDGERSPPERANLLDGLLGVHEALCPGRGRERTPAVRLLRQLGLDEDVRDRDVRAGACERQRIRTTQAARAARDERDASGEIDLE